MVKALGKTVLSEYTPSTQFQSGHNPHPSQGNFLNAETSLCGHSGKIATSLKEYRLLCLFDRYHYSRLFSPPTYLSITQTPLVTRTTFQSNIRK